MGLSLLVIVGGLTLLVLIVVVVLATMSLSSRESNRPHRSEIMHCPHCRAVVSPLDRRCPKCDRPLKPQGIEKLDPDAR